MSDAKDRYQFKDAWIEAVYNKLHLMHPEDSKDQIISYAEKLYEKKFKDTDCYIYNNYEKTKYDTTIKGVVEFIENTKPIITESGTLFKQHRDAYNPAIEIISDKLALRDTYKGKMFDYENLANNSTDPKKVAEYQNKAKQYNDAQSRTKVIVNADYGVSGLSSSWCFNIACASATTCKGQALISTAFNAFEDFLTDSVKFTDMDECIDFIYNINSEKESRTHIDSEWVEDKNKIELLSRLRDKFINQDDFDINIISKIIDNLSQEDINRIYYKSNLYEFINNSDRAQSILTYIISCKSFMNPNKPDKEYKDSLRDLRNAAMEYVHYNYQFNDRVLRLRTHKRKTVVAIDTDSNFINLGNWTDFVAETIMHEKEENLDEQDVFKIVNIAINLMTEMINRTLIDFNRRCNVSDDAPGVTKMKNEFLYLKILFTEAKKHYQGIIRLREGNLIPNNIKKNFDIKGMEYMKKSIAGDNAREFTRDIIYNDILSCKGSPDLVHIYHRLHEFEESVAQSLDNDDYTFLKTANVKTMDAYAEPMSQGPYKAVFVWNYLFPDKTIDLPGVAIMIPVKMIKPKDFAHLSVTDPELFEKIMDLFTNNPNISRSGIKNIALPLNETLPKSLKPYVNITDIIAKNLSLLFPVTQGIGIKTIYKTKSTEFFGNIIDI